MVDYEAVATCGFGLESVLSHELQALGMRNIRAEDGRVRFIASGQEIARANLWLRCAERVLIILREYPAPDFDALFDGAGQVPWGELIERTEAFPVKGYTMNSALSSVPACQAVLKKALVERLLRDHRTQFLPETGGVTKRVRFSIVKDICTLMLDTSGDGLHKRGYRPLRNEAPIKETLAAGMADFARVGKDSNVADPFCGSGTLLIESALRAKNIAPGLRRKFAGEQYGFLGRDAFKVEREAAQAAIRGDVAFQGRGMDLDPAAAALAKENAARAGVADGLEFSAADATAFVPRENELVLCNPPYGERLMAEGGTEQLYADFGTAMRAGKCKGLYIISGHSEFERWYGEKARRRRKLYNGMIPCQLFMYF